MSLHHHVDDLALRPTPSNHIKSIQSQKEVLLLGDLYTTATHPFLFCIVTSQTRNSVKDVIFKTCTVKDK